VLNHSSPAHDVEELAPSADPGHGNLFLAGYFENQDFSFVPTLGTVALEIPVAIEFGRDIFSAGETNQIEIRRISEEVSF
jgi:hypothetical protein